MNPIVDFALYYLKTGLSVIPLKPKEKKPAISTWKDFQHRLPTVEEIQQWWAMFPDANIGIVTGKISGLIVLDVDGENGRNSLDKLAEIDGIITTPYTNTGKGHHYLYRHPGGEWPNFAGKLPGLDFRGDGGYIVAPPSIHPSGRQYEWVINPWDAKIADPPEWLLNLILTKPAVSSTSLTIPVVKKINSHLIGATEAEVILNNCAFIQHCRDYAKSLIEPKWFAMITNLARSGGGHELIHELSQQYPGYNESETDLKIEHSLQRGGPQTCKYIQDNLGFAGCPTGGCGVKAPVGFVSSQLMLAKITVNSAIQELRHHPKGETIFEEDVIGSLAVLKERDAIEYGKIKTQIKDMRLPSQPE